MTKSRNTKHALLMSIVSIMLCCTMLIGSTLAWFTDSVSSVKNRIVAGNLDVKLFYKTGDMADWKDVEELGPDETDPFFRNADGGRMLWEPGVIGITSFKVENVGTLAFKYALALLAVEYNQLDGNDLRDVIKFAEIDGELAEGFSKEDALKLDFSAFHDFTKRSELLPNDGVENSGPDQEIFTIVAYWEPNDNETDNLYNLSNGKIATELDGTPSDPNELYLDIDIRLNAWQNTVEEDSFDNQYDAMADALDTFPDGCYTVTPHDTWVELDIYTGRSTEDIHISYTGYAPDNTDERMASWQANSSGTIKSPAANGNTHLIFFKTEGKRSFVLTQDGRALSALKKVKEDGTIAQSIADQSRSEQSGVVYSTRNAVAPAADMKAASAPAVTADLNNAVSVSNEAEMLAVLADLNKNGGEKTVKLTGNIDLTNGWSLTNGTLTILGEGHSIDIKRAVSISVGGNNATLNLGADNYSSNLYINLACTSSGIPLISVSGNAQMNICKNAVIDGKRIDADSGMYISENATLNLLGGTIQNCNDLGSTGGAINMVGSSKFYMFSGEIKDCSAVTGPGAVRVTHANNVPSPESYAEFYMIGGTISGCSGKGGAVLLNMGTTFNMSGGTIENCTGKERAGGVFVGDTAVFNMSGGTISNCVSQTGRPYTYGGGVYMQNEAVFNMSGGAMIESCQGDLGGGVCMIQSSKFNMSGEAIIESCQSFLGGGVFAGSDTVVTMSGGTIRKCGSTAVGGGVYMQDNTTFNMSGGTIRECVAQEVGGGVYMEGTTVFNMSGETKLYNNTAKEGGDDIARVDPNAKLILGNVNTEVELSDGYEVDGWYIDEPDNRWGSENYSYDAAKIATGETAAQFIKAAHGEITLMEGVGAPGRLLDLYNGEDNSALISKGGAKTVKWVLRSGDLANCVNTSAPIKEGTKITMAYKNSDSTIVNYYYLIVPADTTTISLSEFIAMGRNEYFVLNTQVRNPIYQFSFVFPEDQGNMDVCMSNEASGVSNESAVGIAFAETRIPAPSGVLEASGSTVTVSDLTGFGADQSDSRHNTIQKLADRRAVLAIEAVDAQGRTVAMSGDTTVTVGGDSAKVSGGIAVAEITGDGNYAIDVQKLPKDAVEIKVSLCYTDNNIIQKPLANVLASAKVKSQNPVD